ncbi:MAG: hypothetical protein K0S23_770 [Fluviicola sp.]|jgi:hypothetical protein|nr:hypothetical protein [Fluviicola sp.]
MNLGQYKRGLEVKKINFPRLGQRFSVNELTKWFTNFI